MTKLRWEVMTAQYSYGHSGYLGKYLVAEVTQPVQSKSYTGPGWSARVMLPGIAVRSGLYKETAEEAMGVADKVVGLWVAGAGLDQ